ncbi:unnamed protein product [Mesocestoides corti]|uniref:Uncharacterized protein n=1 Tax=Mesocestoides corti TaxID=53468 RepID=A0A3P6G6I8_MESCO|nr:unnamed protein product [Mesocestoides corti]
MRGFKQMDETIVNYSESDLAPASFSLPIDAILSRVKSKKEGQSFSRQVTTYTNQLEEALSNMDRKLSAQEALLKNIDKAMLFYSAQQKEAAVVTNAYKSYEQQVRNTLSTICNESGISEADKSPVAVEMATDDDDAEPVVSSLQATDAAPPKFFEDDDEEDGVDAGGGGASDMSEEEDEGNPDPFGIRRQISTSTIDIKDLLVDPKSLSHLPFSNFIFTDDRGDVDYRPMFAKMVASKFATTKEAVGENPRGTDTRAAKEVLDEETVDENMDLSDDGDAGAVEGKTSVSNASALTETGDFDYRQPVVAQGGKCENEDNSSNGDPFGLGKGASRGQDSDLRFPKSSVTEQPPLVGDSDYRQFPHPPKQSLPSTTSASLSWETNGDSDLRQRQVATAAAAAAASMYNTAIANAVAAQSLLFAPPPPPQPLFVPLLTPQTAPVLPTVLPQAQTLPVPVTSSVITCHQNHQSEASVSAPLVSSPHKHQIPVTTSTFTMQQPYPSAAASTASAHVCLPNISPDLLSTLKKINLPAVSSSAKSPERPNASPSSKPTAAPSQSDAVTKLLQQKHSASIKTEPEKLQGEDPFTIISRLTGLSNLIQCVKPAHESAPSQPVEIPTTMATSSSDSEKPLATVLDAQTTPNYSEDSSEEEDNVIGKEAHSTSLITPSASGVIGGDGDLEEEEEGDGGDTPTQDESEVSREAAPAPNCFPYQQAGLGAGVLTQPNFSPLVAQKPMGPPPLPGNPNNLLLSFPML